MKKHCDWLVLSLLFPTPSSDNESSDSSDSDSVELMTQLTTPVFDFYQLIKALTTPTPVSFFKCALFISVSFSV